MNDPYGDGSARGPVDVVVTGAAGFIGEALVRRLRKEGLTVQGVDIAAGELPTVRMDVTDGAAVLEVLRRVEPRRIVHAAALVDERGDPDRFQEVNVAGTQNMLDAAASVGVERFVHISSIAALGLDPGPNAGEGTPLDPNTGSPYFDTKAASEELVRHAMAGGRLKGVIVRPGDVYGPRSKPWVERPLSLMRKKMPVLIGGGAGLIAHCWIDNLVDGIVLALNTPEIEGGIFQIHDGTDTTTYRDYFTRLAAAAGLAPPRASMPEAAASALGHAFALGGRLVGGPVPFTPSAIRYICRRSTYSIASARDRLGYVPRVGLDEGMERLGQWLRDRPPSR
ncbi:MAG: NAD(P)-dependent oxidoreductase [Myxococcota bacterium]